MLSNGLDETAFCPLRIDRFNVAWLLLTLRSIVTMWTVTSGMSRRAGIDTAAVTARRTSARTSLGARWFIASDDYSSMGRSLEFCCKPRRCISPLSESVDHDDIVHRVADVPSRRRLMFAYRHSDCSSTRRLVTVGDRTYPVACSCQAFEQTSRRCHCFPGTDCFSSLA